MKQSLIVKYIFLLGSIQVFAQRAPKVDSTHMLLLNPYVQIEATKSINQLYNFEFDSSMQNMTYLKYEYGWHPLPHFLMGLNYWWRIQPNLNDKKYDDVFNAYMDTSIYLARRLHREVNPIEGSFFLAASYGFKARLQSDRGNYRKAALNGQRALKYLDESQEYTEYSPELLFGDGLINYYSDWIRENYPWLRPLMALFPKGNKTKGIEQLREVSRNAFYARTEAQYYLMTILFHDKSNYEEAKVIAKYLYKTYPNNSFFHRWYMRIIFQLGHIKEAETECLKIIQRIDSGQVGYGNYTGRYAAYFLGRIYKNKRQKEKSVYYYEKSKTFHEKVNATDKGYYHDTLLQLGLIAKENGNNEKAQTLLKQVKKLARRRDYVFKEAKKRLRDM